MLNQRIQELKTKVNKFLDPVKPRYSELTTYQAAVTFILLVIFYPEILSGFYTLIMKDMENNSSVFPLYVIPFTLIMLGGITLSIWHVFVKWEKSKGEKFLMGAFAVFISGLAGLLATLEFLPDKWSPLLIFPLWNYLWGILLMDRLAAPQEAITDEEANKADWIGATILVVLTFSVSHFILGYSWPMIFSICMSISSMVLLLFRKIIGPKSTIP